MFSGGVPPVECLPLERLGEALASVAHVDPRALYYGESTGHEPLRALIAERMARRGAAVSPDDVLVTNGSQQGIDLVARALIDPGDRVVVEAPTYFGAMQTFDHYQPEYVPVPVDGEGIVPEALERALAATPRPKLIYTVPTFQNPTGVTLSPARRRAVVDLAHRYGVPIVEDDPYGELWLEGGDPGPLRALDPEVIYLGTFSKTLAPALRMGWMVAPRPILELCAWAKEGVDIQSDRLMQRAVVAVAAGGWLDAHIDAARACYRARRDAMLACLEREMPPGVTWTRPLGGFFVWVTLPEGADADALLPVCAEAGVAYVPGSACYPGRDDRRSLRLGFTTLSEERIAEGIARLGRVFRARLA
ncbi:MAG: PLP-dependent aminotransferase family protein [Thermomicrobiaceae bacterium]|nr:PLP-dependent aminotransferase family protein [Thermomicrobiaceae bacterium]